MKIWHKIKNRKGESIVEVLCAILVVALAAGLLMSCFTLSRNMAEQAKKADENLLENITNAEVFSSPPTTGLQAEIKYTGSDTPTSSTSIPVDAYGGNNVYSYKKVP